MKEKNSGARFRRLLDLSAFRFELSGWYGETDQVMTAAFQIARVAIPRSRVASIRGAFR